MIKYSWLIAIGLTLGAGCNTGDPAGATPHDGGNDGTSSSNGSTTGSTGFFPDPDGGAIGSCNGGGIGGTIGGSGGMVPVPINLPTTPVVAARRPPALSGGTLTVSPDGKFAVAADPDRDKVFVVDLALGTSRTVQLTRGSEPGRVAFDGAGRAHVALRSGGALAQIDTAAAKLLRQTAICEFPRGVAYNGTSDVMLVACASGDVVTLAAADHAERARSFVELDLRDVLITKDQRTLVTTFRGSELIELAADGKVLRRAVPGTSKKERFSISPTTCGPEIETLTMRPHIAWRTALRADGTPVMLHQRSQEEEVKLSEPGGYGGGSCSTVTETTIDTVPLTGAAQGGWTIAATMAVDFATSADGHWMAIAAAGGYLHGRGTLQVYSSGSVEQPTPGPGSCMGPFTEESSGFQVTAVAFDSAGRLLAQSREPAQLRVYTIDAADYGDAGAPTYGTLALARTITLDSESVRDTGHDLFHADVGGGLACASCHPEGRDDAHTWNFQGIGPRRSQTMGGGLSGTEPFHWDGDMTHFQHLVDQVMTGRMGGFAVEKKYGDALLGWIDQLPAIKLAAGKHAATDMSKVARGKLLFESSECATCHTGAALTNNISVDVGTGGSFQVPSLRGLALRGPFMHDGCAKTLVSRFDDACGGGDRHGKTSQLTDAEIADLTAYLSTL